MVLIITMTFTVDAQAKVGDKKDGGIVFWLDSTGNHGLIADVKDLGKFTWREAINACKNKGEGWYLPDKSELDKLYQNKDKVGGFATGNYWSSSEWEAQDYNAFYQNFTVGYKDNAFKTASNFYVRAVRAF